MFANGMVVKDSAGMLLEVESVVDAGEGYVSLRGVQLKSDLTPDRRKWSQRASILHSPTLPVEIIKG